MRTTESYLLKSHGIVWRIEQTNDAMIQKSRASAKDQGEPLYPQRFVRLLEKSGGTQTAFNRFSPMGSPEPVTVWLSRSDKLSLEQRVRDAVEAGSVPQDSLVRLSSGTLNLGLVKNMLGIRTQAANGGLGVVRDAYTAHGQEMRKAGNYSDLRAAAAELDALVEQQNRS